MSTAPETPEELAAKERFDGYAPILLEAIDHHRHCHGENPACIHVSQDIWETMRRLRIYKDAEQAAQTVGLKVNAYIFENGFVMYDPSLDMTDGDGNLIARVKTVAGG